MKSFFPFLFTWNAVEDRDTGTNFVTNEYFLRLKSLVRGLIVFNERDIIKMYA